jgi:hypothetical protein
VVLSNTTVQKSKFWYLLFSNPTQNLKLGLQIGLEIKIANDLANEKKQGATVRSYLLHPSLVGVNFAVPFTSLSKLWQKCWAKTACFDFSSSNFNLQGSHTEQLV